jgi:glycosyltransferase involved in cell wall biosynthesis
MKVLIVLAYNEELYIEKAISSHIELFDKVVIVNDSSSDNTSKILEKLSKKNSKIETITNKKNYGPGKSMNIALKEAIQLGAKVIVKIDGDNQFKPQDIKDLLQLAEKNKSDFIKCDRFWSGGIEGDIPKIRYFGNAFASLLIKAITGKWSITDPLNGLFLFSSTTAKEVVIPKFFNRYGYPFYINLSISKIGIKKNLNLHQFRNTITYADEKSQLRPVSLFFKLITYSFYYFSSTIKTKLQDSNYQISGLIDVSALISLSTSMISFFMFVLTRYFSYQGNQHTWFLMFIIFIILFIVLVYQSPKSIKYPGDNDFKYLN